MLNYGFNKFFSRFLLSSGSERRKLVIPSLLLETPFLGKVFNTLVENPLIVGASVVGVLGLAAYRKWVSPKEETIGNIDQGEIGLPEAQSEVIGENPPHSDIVSDFADLQNKVTVLQDSVELLKHKLVFPRIYDDEPYSVILRNLREVILNSLHDLAKIELDLLKVIEAVDQIGRHL